MAASWFTGFIYIKRQPAPGESYCDCSYKCESFKVLGFINGKLVHQETATSMKVLVDSIDIANKPQKYPERYYNGFQRETMCKRILKEKLSTTSNQWISESFSGDSNDDMIWNDTRFMCSESPLSTFANYKSIFPNVGEFISQAYLPTNINEKNYWVKWTIIDNKLYLFDVDCHKDNISEQEYANRYKVIEKFTRRKYKQLPSQDQKVLIEDWRSEILEKVMFADWYSGTLHIKRYPIEIKYIEGCDSKCYEAIICNYDCEHFDKIVFEKGKIKSIEKVNYMIKTWRE
jgi:hypothetical protein